MKKKLLLLAAFMLSIANVAKAQVNAQLFYDFGDDREFVTLTLEMFKADKWGNTYFFVDHDFYYDSPEGNNMAPGGSYFEISRALNFWQNTCMKNWSLHAEYNGGITKDYPINNAWLFGVEYFMHDKTYQNTLTLQALYKTIRRAHSNVPMQLTAVWTCKDLFGLKGVTFCGFADFWWEDHQVDYTTTTDAEGNVSVSSKTKHTVFSTEPQLWYNVGRLFGCDNLSVGTEVELTQNFGSTGGFKCRPCLGAKWDF